MLEWEKGKTKEDGIKERKKDRWMTKEKEKRESETDNEEGNTEDGEEGK